VFAVHLISPTVADKLEFHVMGRSDRLCGGRKRRSNYAVPGPDAAQVDNGVGPHDVSERVDAGLPVARMNQASSISAPSPRAVRSPASSTGHADGRRVSPVMSESDWLPSGGRCEPRRRRDGCLVVQVQLAAIHLVDLSTSHIKSKVPRLLLEMLMSRFKTDLPPRLGLLKCAVSVPVLSQSTQNRKPLRLASRRTKSRSLARCTNVCLSSSCPAWLNPRPAYIHNCRGFAMMKNPRTLASLNNFWLRTLVQLKPGVDAEPVREKLRATFRAIQEERVKGFPTQSKRDRERMFQEKLCSNARPPAAPTYSRLPPGARGSWSCWGLALLAVVALYVGAAAAAGSSNSFS